MPFYKWIIGGQDNRLDALDSSNSLESKYDSNALTNLHLVRAIRNLSELVQIAQDVYGAIEKDCQSVLKRTNNLKTKVQNCQAIVNNLNAKTVKVPVSSLSDHPVGAHFSSRHGEEPGFCTLPRPPAVSRLCQMATDPPTDGKAPATHIYCQPIQAKGVNMCRNSIFMEKSSICDNVAQTSVPSTIVPIDVSGQPFSRMASLRRSLIHVDFFVRKKKDKRRNTVAEGEAKELKDAIHNIINEKRQQTTFSKSNFNRNSVFRHSIETKHANKTREYSVESNCITPNEKRCDENDQRYEKNNSFTFNEHVKMDSKSTKNADVIKSTPFNKRKLKSHIPISTLSAAMNVAVEMRQLNGKKSEDRSSSGNWSYGSSSDTESKRTPSENSTNGTISEENRTERGTSPEVLDSSGFNGSNSDFEESITKRHAFVQSNKKEQKAEISDYNSSDNATTQDDASSNATSAESEVFFMSSDEDDSDSILEQQFGSRLSISTLSVGSLNSLLSQTGTEMTSSTGTLTSVGFDRLPTPPPPPIVTPTSPVDNGTESVKQKSNVFGITPLESSIKNKASEKNSKQSKSHKNEKNSKDKSRKLFSSIVSIKPRSKIKCTEQKKKEIKQLPYINMYGNSSPETLKRIPSFIKENISPHSINEHKINSMQSFSSKSSKNECDVLQEKKIKPSSTESKEQMNFNNPQYHTNNKPQPIVKDDCPSHEEQNDIPFKYLHKVTVTPIQRQTNCDLATECRKPNGNYQQHLIMQNCMVSQKPGARISLNGNNSGMHSVPRAQRPMTLQPEKSKPAARVLLDPDGKVIKTTNSLERKTNAPFTHGLNDEIVNSNAKCRKEIVGNSRTDNKTWNGSFSPAFHSSPCHEALHKYNNHIFKVERNTNSYNPTTSKVIVSDSIYRDPNSNEKYYPSNFTISVDKENYIQRGEVDIRSIRTFDKENANTVKQAFHYPPDKTPNPNTSGLPEAEATYSKQYNGNPTIKKETFNKSLTEKSSAYENPSSALQTSANIFNSDSTKRHQSTMSTEDLFAVIHNCKKRMNIKTDSDISLASSSRSSSPSCSRPPSSKGTLAETGFLSPRKLTTLDNPGDRRSWADFRPSNSMPSERKSLACDRLGPTKPTSMHDFKMLLLQTRSSSQTLGPRKSAVEMLKLSTPPDKTSTAISPKDSLSYSVPNSPSTETYLYNGHSTVPFKRNNRARASLQLRYTMYPPIFEDCSEETENNHHPLQNNSRKNLTNLEDTVREVQTKHNGDGCRENMVWL